MNERLTSDSALSQNNWIFHLSCDMLVQKNFSIGIVRAMRLAYKLSVWTDSFYSALKSVIEAFLMLDEKTGSALDD
jgi:hypothetical protein